jgi:hypothetical protein
MLVSDEVKKMSLPELRRLRFTLDLQLTSGQIDVEEFMRADIEIMKLISEREVKANG